MHVGIDGGCWSNRRGYGRFLRELLEALAASDSRNQYSVFLDPEAHASFHLRDRFRPVLVPTSQTVDGAARADGSRSPVDMLRMSYAVRRTPVDVFFFSSVFSYFPLLRPVPMILGVHDTIADKNPHFSFASRRQHLFWQGKVKLALAQADTVLTVSEYSKQCIERVLGIPSTRIRVLSEAASHRFRRLDTAASPVNGEPFLLYVGGISPNKNLATLIRAFHRLEAARHRARLVLVGDYQSDGFKSCYAELRQLITSLSLESAVHFAGYVPDEELIAMYNHASAFVMPSFDEGFGLPAVEAMACGAPVIVSSGNSLSEVTGDAGLIVDPRDEAGLAQAMERVLSNPEFAAELSRKSLARSAQFSWTRAAETLLDVFEETYRLHKR
jgi:glycosyltransferase involved in cell wall biosynthesis